MLLYFDLGILARVVFLTFCRAEPYQLKKFSFLLLFFTFSPSHEDRSVARGEWVFACGAIM